MPVLDLEPVLNRARFLRARAVFRDNALEASAARRLSRSLVGPGAAAYGRPSSKSIPKGRPDHTGKQRHYGVPRSLLELLPRNALDLAGGDLDGAPTLSAAPFRCAIHQRLFF
jgi:hypothetical protein